MAVPPYTSIAGITRAAMKDNEQVTIQSYDGVARPGELVVDQLTDNLYVGDPAGNLTLVGPTLSQLATTGNVTLSQSNQNTQIYAGAGNYVFVPNDSQNDLPVGYGVLVVSAGGSTYVSPNGTGVTTIYVAGTGGSSVSAVANNVEVPDWSMASLIKVDADTWMIAGASLVIN